VLKALLVFKARQAFVVSLESREKLASVVRPGFGAKPAFKAKRAHRVKRAFKAQPVFRV
jgi:hypothetical protein